MFKIGDIVRLKSNLDKNIYIQFLHRDIMISHKLKIVKINSNESLAFEGKWENGTFKPIFFEIVSNRKERIENLYKVITND